MKKTILFVVMLTSLIALSGCTKGNILESTEVAVDIETSTVVETTIIQEEPTNSEQKLIFSVVASETPGYTVVSSEELAGKTDIDIAYLNLAEVNIRISEKDISLPEAIRTGVLSIPEIFAFARIDAQNGFCKEGFVSLHGLNHFSYIYPECELYLTYDVLETPSGEQKLIEEIYICDISDGQRSSNYFYVDEESEWGYFLDREDWGLTFELLTVTPEQITLDYTQQGGQQIGDLFIDGYTLYPQEKKEETDNGPDYIGRSKRNAAGFPIPITMNSSGKITIDWMSTIGTLEPGNYYIQLNVTDIYAEEAVHPLMENYHDKQSYHITFSLEKLSSEE